MNYFLIPLIIVGSVVLLFGIVVFLGRFRNGKYLRPIIAFLSKIPWLRRQFQKVSHAAIERQNPELASAMRKLQRVGPNADVKRVQQAYQSLSPEERRAYQEAAEQQGVSPEPANRQMRRAQERMAQTNRPRPSSRGGSSGGGKRGKKR